MLRRNRFWIIGMAITVSVVILCLFVPDILLAVDRQNTIGQVQQGHQQYYADDVAADDGSGFNFQRRLMMLSGKWRADKAEVQPQEGMLELEGFEQSCSIVAGTLFEFVMQGLYDEERMAIYDGMASLTDQLMADPNGDSVDAEGNASGDAEELPRESVAWDGNMDLGQLLFLLGKSTLYQYSDSIMNTYSFFVWEYDLTIPIYGIEFHLLLDAVTLDLYSFSVKLSQDLPMRNMEDVLTESIYKVNLENGNSLMDGFREDLGIEFSGPSPLMIPMYMDTNSYFIHQAAMSDGKVFSISGEPEYNYKEGHFLKKGNYTTEMLYGDTLKFTSERQTVYARMEFDQGVQFYFTSDEPDPLIY